MSFHKCFSILSLSILYAFNNNAITTNISLRDIISNQPERIYIINTSVGINWNSIIVPDGKIWRKIDYSNNESWILPNEF